MKKIFSVLALITLFIFSSCEKDLYEDSIKNSSRKIEIKSIALSEINSITSSKILNKVEEYKRGFTQSNRAGKFAYNAALNLYIDYDNGKLIELYGKQYYTFPMFRRSEENLENILFIQNENGLVDLYFVKYDVKPEDLKDLTNDEKNNISIQIHRQTGYLICFDVINRFLQYPEGCTETHSNGYTCTPEVVTEITTFCDWVSAGGGGSSGSNSSGSTSGGGGGGSNGSSSTNETIPPIITSIIGLTPTQINFKDFITNLPIEFENWLNNVANDELKQELEHYFDINSQNGIVLSDIYNTIDILDDGKVNGEDILVSPDEEITNMVDYLSCFDLTQGATLTIYADQPVTGSHSIFSFSETVGHAFISIKQGTKIKTFGFYPQCSPCSLIPNYATPMPTDFLSVNGVFGNDQNHSFDVSLSTTINSIQLTNIVNGVIAVVQSNPMYNLGNMNCTDIAINIFESQTSIDIPSCESPGIWVGQTPGTLGQIIRNLILPTGTTRNTTGGNAPPNSSN